MRPARFIVGQRLRVVNMEGHDYSLPVGSMVTVVHEPDRRGGLSGDWHYTLFGPNGSQIMGYTFKEYRLAPANELEE